MQEWSGKRLILGEIFMRVERWALDVCFGITSTITNKSMSTSRNEFRIISADHTGITVSNLERSLAFWRDVLGLELSHTAHQKGELAQEITGVEGAEIKLAVLKTPGGHKIELLEYLAPADRKRADLRSCDVGSVHVALLVEDLNAALDRIAVSGWKTAGQPQILTKGPNAGRRVVYVRDPDGTTIEFMQVRAA
jgi:catechol 2,3-dioxygenase-like lactoylglutathione lyase family enzyme